VTDPYTSPKSKIKSGESISGWVLPLSFGITLISTLVYVGIYLAIPSFQDIFESFGADLPALTNFILSTYYFYALFSLLGWVPSVLLYINKANYKAKEKRLFAFVVINLVLAFMTLMITVIGLYQPINQMGSVV